jgi:hypothetical protein
VSLMGCSGRPLRLFTPALGRRRQRLVGAALLPGVGQRRPAGPRKSRKAARNLSESPGCSSRPEVRAGAGAVLTPAVHPTILGPSS